MTACRRQSRAITSNITALCRTIVKLRCASVPIGTSAPAALTVGRRPLFTRSTPTISVAARHHDMAHTRSLHPTMQEPGNCSLSSTSRNPGPSTSAARAHQKHISVQSLRDRMAATEQLHRVDVLARQESPGAEPDRDREYRWQHDVVVARHLEHHGDRGHRGAGAAADHRAHADHRKCGNADRQTGKDGMEQSGERSAQRRAHEQRWREDAAGGAGAQAQRGRQQLADIQQQQEPCAVKLIGQRRLDGRVADALDIVVPAPTHQRVHAAAPTSSMPDDVAQVVAWNLVEQILEPMQTAHEHCRRNADQRAEYHVQHQDRRALRLGRQCREVRRERRMPACRRRTAGR